MQGRSLGAGSGLGPGAGQVGARRLRCAGRSRRMTRMRCLRRAVRGTRGRGVTAKATRTGVTIDAWRDQGPGASSGAARRSAHWLRCRVFVWAATCYSKLPLSLVHSAAPGSSRPCAVCPWRLTQHVSGACEAKLLKTLRCHNRIALQRQAPRGAAVARHADGSRCCMMETARQPLRREGERDYETR